MRDPTLMPSTFADRYQIQRELGHGGMATVYLARDARNGRSVALKVLHPDLTHALGLERFHREIAITANLTHPNILPLHDSGEADGQFYYVMPYIEGESLRDRLRRDRQLSLRDALCIARGVSSALEHAHAHGIVHRDIKPENILLADGQPLVADFGIARAPQAETERLTATGLSLGTPAYMSPEQATGESVVDARTDIYSLGCVLYEMLAGEPPFTGVNPQVVIAKRMTSPAPDIRSIRDIVPDSLAQAIARALARVPADRFQTMSELRAVLEQAELECASPAASTGGRAMSSGRPVRMSRRRSLTLGAVAVATSALLALGLWLRQGAGRASGIHTLAVLPLSSMSPGMGGMGTDIFADGMTEALINGLSQLGSLNVISRTSVMQYRMMHKSVREIARDLHADAVLEGAVVRSGDRVRITAKLVRASDEGALWADSYERQLGDALALQTDIAEAVAQEIGVRLASNADRPRAVKPAAQEAYLKGSYFAGQWRLAEAIPEFQRAVEIDPNHSAAYAALARAYYFRAFFGEIAPAEAFSQMRRAAGRALERDERSAEAHGLMALVNTHYDWDWTAAEQHFKRALALSPSDAQVHHDYAHFLLATGRRAESVSETKRALELDPANPMLTSCVGWHSLFDKRFDEAEAYAIEAQRMMPSFWAQVIKGWAYIGKHQNDSALVVMRNADSLSGKLAFTRAALAHALAQSGHTAEARQILAELLNRSLRGYVSAYDIAIVYAGLHENDHAIEWLDKAMGERSMFVVHLSWDPRLDDLRKDPRFAELAKRLGVPATAASRSPIA